MVDTDQRTAQEVGRLSEAVRQMERKADEHADTVRESIVALRDDLRSDMREIREGMAEDVKGIAAHVADLHNRLQNPDSGIIKIVSDHERRIKGVEGLIASIRNGVRRALWWLFFGVAAFVGAALIRHAPNIGKWISEVKGPTTPGGS